MITEISFSSILGGFGTGDVDGDGAIDLVLSVDHEVDGTPLEAFVGDGMGGFAYAPWNGERITNPVRIGRRAGGSNDSPIAARKSLAAQGSLLQTASFVFTQFPSFFT